MVGIVDLMLRVRNITRSVMSTISEWSHMRVLTIAPRKHTGDRIMPTLVATPTRIEAAGNKPKLIDEYIGLVNSRQENVSIAHMRSPAGWVEPGQTPDFDEYTIVLKGMLRVA